MLKSLPIGDKMTSSLVLFRMSFLLEREGMLSMLFASTAFSLANPLWELAHRRYIAL